MSKATIIKEVTSPVRVTPPDECPLYRWFAIEVQNRVIAYFKTREDAEATARVWWKRDPRVLFVEKDGRLID